MRYIALKVRVYPTQEQVVLLNKTLDACRAFYNMMLTERKTVYELYKTNTKELYTYKYKTPKMYKDEFSWLSEDVDSQALNVEVMNLKSAYSNFFKSLKTGKSFGFPKFKKRKMACSYSTCVTNHNILVNYEDSKLRLPIIGWLDFRDGKRKFEGTIKKATVSRSPTGKYFVSVLYEQDDFILPEKSTGQRVIGLDMSLQNFFVDSNGNSPAYEKIYRKNEQKLNYMQRKASKKKPGSKNSIKAQKKISRVHEKIANSRKDFTQKLSNELVNENDVIVVETLSLQGMSQALRLGKSVMDLGYSEFIKQLQYKCLWRGKTLVEASKWFPSSKTCNVCGYVYKELKLAEREWVCPNCETTLQRDVNAAINLKNIGWGTSNFKPVEIPSMVGSMKQENRKIDL